MWLHLKVGYKKHEYLWHILHVSCCPRYLSKLVKVLAKDICGLCCCGFFEVTILLITALYNILHEKRITQCTTFLLCTWNFWGVLLSAFPFCKVYLMNLMREAAKYPLGEGHINLKIIEESVYG